MRHRLTLRLSDDLARGIETRARRTGKTKSEVVRQALTLAGLAARSDPEGVAALLGRAAALRARQSQQSDVVALLREARGGSALRLTLKKLRVPFVQADLG